MFFVQVEGRGMDESTSREEMNQEEWRKTEASRWKWDSCGNSAGRAGREMGEMKAEESKWEGIKRAESRWMETGEWNMMGKVRRPIKVREGGGGENDGNKREHVAQVTEWYQVG